MKRWWWIGVVVVLALTRAARADSAPVPAEQLLEAIAAAAPGDTIEITGGEFHGNLVIDKPLTLIGRDGPVLDGDGAGTVLTINAPDTSVSGFVIRNSGDTLVREDGGILVTAPRALIADNRLEDVLFGVSVLAAPGTVVRGNSITGKQLDIARRGDLIRIWDSDDVVIENNVTRDGRDVVLWYSERLALRGNDFSGGRYGLHFMYCDDAEIAGNRLANNSVGAYLMYGRRMHLRDNLIAGNRGPSGFGIGLKDMDDAVITGNRFLDNRVGAYVDGSPREMDSTGIIRGNLFAYNDIGMELLPSVRHNEVSDNSFVENEQQVVISGGGHLAENEWTVDGRGNYWSDYAGYDGDGDGLGEIDYRAEHLLDSLIGRRAELRLFLYSPVVNAVEFAARAFPAVRPQPVLTDTRPLTRPVLPTDAPLPRTTATGDVWLVLFLLPVPVVVFLLQRAGSRRYHLPAMSAQVNGSALGGGNHD